MTLHLMKNGEVLSELIPSSDHPLPEKRENCWHDCTIVAVKKIEARPVDCLNVVIGNHLSIPFRFSRCRVGPQGWEVEGKVLF